MISFFVSSGSLFVDLFDDGVEVEDAFDSSGYDGGTIFGSLKVVMEFDSVVNFSWT